MEIFSAAFQRNIAGQSRSRRESKGISCSSAGQKSTPSRQITQSERYRPVRRMHDIGTYVCGSEAMSALAPVEPGEWRLRPLRGWSHRRLNVRVAATEIGGRIVLGDPKTHEVRTIVMPRSIAALLDAHIVGGDRSPTDLVFTTPKGVMLRSSNFGHRVWKPAIAALAATDPRLADLRIHDLRHTAASLAISCGANIKAIQRMLGHRRASMTLDTYGWLYDDDLEDLAERLDQRLQGIA